MDAPCVRAAIARGLALSIATIPPNYPATFGMIGLADTVKPSQIESGARWPCYPASICRQRRVPADLDKSVETRKNCPNRHKFEARDMLTSILNS